jgi:hypothetical protein
MEKNVNIRNLFSTEISQHCTTLKRVADMKTGLERIVMFKSILNEVVL